MHLFLLTTKEGKNFETNNRAFCSYGDAKAYAKNYDVDFEIKEIYLGDYSYCDYSLSQLPLAGCDKQGLTSAITYTIEHLQRLNNAIDFDNPRENIFEAIFYIEGRLKTLKSFLDAESIKEETPINIKEPNLFNFMEQ